MAQTEIQNLEKILAGINTKLDMLTDDNGEADLVRLYLGELKKILEEEHNGSIAKLEELRSSFSKMVSTQDETTGNRFVDIKRQLDIISDDILTHVNSVPEKISFKSLENEISQIEPSITALREIIKNSSDNTEVLKRFEKLEGKLKNIVSNSDFKDFKTDLADFIQQIIDNSKILHVDMEAFKEDVLPTLEKLELVDYSKDFKNIATRIGEIKSSFENNSKMNYESLLNEINNLKNEINSNLKTKDNSEELTQIDTKLGDLLSNVQFIRDLSSQKYSEILDNISSELNDAVNKAGDKINSNSEINFGEIKSLIDGIVVDLNTIKKDLGKSQNDNSLSISSEFDNLRLSSENLLAAFSALSTSFEERSEKNSENILEGIQNLSNDIDSLGFSFEKTSSQNSENILEGIQNISADISSLNSSFEQTSQQNSENILEGIQNISADISSLNSSFEQASQQNSENILEGIQNISTDISSLNSSFETIALKNSKSILGSLEELSDKTNELKTEFSEITSTLTGKLLDTVNELSDKIDSRPESEDLTEHIQFIKEAVSSISTDIQLSKEEYLQHLKENSEARSAQIETVSENISSFRLQLNEALESIKDYIAELEASSGSIDEKLSQKLVDTEASIIQASQDYEQKLEVLQTKLVEFVHIVENSNADTEGKIASSLDEVASIKEELNELNEVIKASKLSSDEKSSEIVSLLDGSIENILFNINNINEAVQNGFNSALKDSLTSVDTNFEKLTDQVLALKDETSSVKDDILSEISDKISALRKEFDLINTDITDIIQNKSEDLLKAFEPLESRIDEFTGLDFEQLISNLKSQIELSFMNFSVDVNSEFASNYEAISKLEQSYKDAFNKLSSMEDLVSDKINNVELLKVTLESGLMDVKSSFNDIMEEHFDELRSYIEKGFGDKSLENSINNLRSDINNNFENFMSEQSEATLKYAQIANDFSKFSENIKNDLENTNKDLIANVSTGLNEINTKLDIMASDTSNEELQMRFDDISEVQSKAENLINILNTKIDALASDSTNLVVLDELDDIKNIISEQISEHLFEHINKQTSEQKSFIQSLSSEKFAKINDYLEETLDKLNNLDLNKNSEDIKETILNAIISLTDQITFVEETEEIKDFVEEKTDKLNDQIIEVQNQLKQLASNDDDSFEYKYTLQDVETDIAKLRVAINEMSGSNANEISKEIQNLVKSLENLDTSLTQEQVESIKNDIEKLNEDIISISSRTNKLLLNSDESYKALNDGLNKFSSIINKFDSARLERKIDNIQALAANSANADKVFHQAMMYLGEWVDATSEDISGITDQVSAISDIQNDLSDVKKSITESESVFDEIKNMMPDNSQVIDALKNEFNYQEKRIDTLENKLDKILSILSEQDDKVLTRKVEKLEKMISNLGANIEKLTSYVE